MLNHLEQVERERTHLQKRKVSTTIKLNNLHRQENEQANRETLHQLEEQLQTTEKELCQLESRCQARRQREKMTLERFGASQDILDIHLPEIRISHASSDPSIPQLCRNLPHGETATNSTSVVKDKKFLWSPKRVRSGLLDVTPLFRRRSGSDSGQNQRYRAMSADVVALPSSTVRNLRLLYTGDSYFEDDIGNKRQLPCESNKETITRDHLPKKEQNRPSPDKSKNVNPREIDPKIMEEIEAFEKLIEKFFLAKQRKR